MSQHKPSYFTLFKDIVTKLELERVINLVALMDLPELELAEPKMVDGELVPVDWREEYWEHISSNLPEAAIAHAKFAKLLTMSAPAGSHAKLLEAILQEPGLGPAFSGKAAPNTSVATASRASANAPLNTSMWFKMITKLKIIFIFTRRFFDWGHRMLVLSTYP